MAIRSYSSNARNLNPGSTPPVYEIDALREKYSHSLDFANTDFHIFRHGESVNNRKSLVSGSAEVPLTSRGKREANALAHELDDVYTLVYCSILSRARDTLGRALKTKDVEAKVFYDPRLNERCLGVLEGKPRVHVPQFAAGDLHFAPSGGESYFHLTQRCLSFVLDVHEAMSEQSQRKVLISTHMGPFRMLRAILEGETDPVRMMAAHYPNTTLLKLRVAVVPWPAFLDANG